jgi:hypothetical protein
MMSRDPNQFFPMPMDIDTNNDTGDIDGSSSSVDDSLPALPGICVVGQERAKRYTNSVCHPTLISATITDFTIFGVIRVYLQ